jgi:hypothetical protein
MYPIYDGHGNMAGTICRSGTNSFTLERAELRRVSERSGDPEPTAVERSESGGLSAARVGLGRSDRAVFVVNDWGDGNSALDIMLFQGH